jgi:hypothetical protein
MFGTGQLRVYHCVDGRTVLLTSISLDGDVTQFYEAGWARTTPRDQLAAQLAAHRDAVASQLDKAVMPLRNSVRMSGWFLAISCTSGGALSPFLGIDLRLLPLVNGLESNVVVAALQASVMVIASAAFRLFLPHAAGRLAWVVVRATALRWLVPQPKLRQEDG